MGDYVNPDGTSPLPPTVGIPGITLPSEFALEAADRSLDGSKDTRPKPEAKPAPKTERVRFPSRDVKVYGEAIARLIGAYSGPGFNIIFRPHADRTPKDAPKGLVLPLNDLLELNLTHELWTFPSVKADLGEIPNRVADPTNREIEQGKTRKDVFLRGIPYTQIVRDVTDTSKDPGRRIPVDRLGKAKEDDTKLQVQDIHFEPGLFIHVEDSKPVSDKATISRMASIPHGTTINAQGFAAKKSDSTEAPKIPFNPNASKPFSLDNSGVVGFFDRNQFKLDLKTATRLPQNMEPFLKKNSIESITPEMVQDPNHLIREHNKNKTFSQVIKFKVSTLPEQELTKQSCPHLAARNARKAMNVAVEQIDKITSAASTKDKEQLEEARKTLTKALELIETPTVSQVQAEREAATAPAIGTANIAFLDGDLGTDGLGEESNPNAKTAKVESTFWISTVVYTIEVKEKFVPGKDSTGNPKFLQPIKPILNKQWAEDTVPQFVFPPDQQVDAGRYTVEATQIQYSQTVDLIFNGLAWPHISVATLVPIRPVVVNFAKRIL